MEMEVEVEMKMELVGLGYMPPSCQPSASHGTTHPQGKGKMQESSEICPGAWGDACTHRRFVTDDSEMDVRLGIEGSASLAAENACPPWKMEGQGWQQGSKDLTGLGVPTAWPAGTCVAIYGGATTPGHQLLLGPSHHLVPTICPWWGS